MWLLTTAIAVLTPICTGHQYWYMATSHTFVVWTRLFSCENCAAQPFPLSRLCSINPSEHYCFCPFFQKASSMAIQIFMECSCTKYAVCLAVKTMRKFCVNFHVVSAKWKPLSPSVSLSLSPSSSFFLHSCH